MRGQWLWGSITLALCAVYSCLSGATADVLVRSCANVPYQPRVLAMGDPRVVYNDPEPLRHSKQVVWQDGIGNMWLAQLDPVTGLFASRHGRDRLLDTHVAPLNTGRNGPEWGSSQNGEAVYYTKQDAGGMYQAWRARIIGGEIRLKQLTHCTEPCRGLRPSVLSSEPSVLIFLGIGDGAQQRTIVISEADPDNQLPIEDYWFAGGGGGRFLLDPDTGHASLLYAQLEPGAPDDVTQMAFRDISTNVTRILTNDGGQKSEPRNFAAPEYGGEMLIAVLIDRLKIAIYRDLHDSPVGYWTRIEELTMPPWNPHPYLYSIKPVGGPPGQDGIAGVSYFTLVAEDMDAMTPTDASMWVMGLGTGIKRTCRRVDPGAVNGVPAIRYEPEPWIGASELFLIYNVGIETPVEPELSRARTGIKLFF